MASAVESTRFRLQDSQEASIPSYKIFKNLKNMEAKYKDERDLAQYNDYFVLF